MKHISIEYVQRKGYFPDIFTVYFGTNEGGSRGSRDVKEDMTDEEVVKYVKELQNDHDWHKINSVIEYTIQKRKIDYDA